jgi:sterol desaturase/sphingolipid hydroxylase (fatty acid hydroxylase superfamily)
VNNPFEIIVLNLGLRLGIFFGISAIVFLTLRLVSRVGLLQPISVKSFAGNNLRHDLFWSSMSIVFLSLTELQFYIYWLRRDFGSTMMLLWSLVPIAFVTIYMLIYWLKRSWLKVYLQLMITILLTMIVSSVLAIIWFFDPGLLQTQIYWGLGGYGWGYLIGSLLLMIVVHDIYFYIIHRLMHWKPLLRIIHSVHHKTHHPNVFTSYAFHPLESVLEFGIFPLFAFLIPLNGWVFVGYQLIIVGFNVYVHSGYTVHYALPFGKSVWKYINSPVEHGYHHSRFNYNFGLYTNIWDRLFGTYYEG